MDEKFAIAITHINYQIEILKSHERPSRDLAVAITNLETGIMWLQRAASEKK